MAIYGKEHNKTKGSWGEDKACIKLERDGCRILARNFRSRHGEIDIIAADEKLLIFAEVKLRTGKEYGMPAEAVGAVKQERLRYTAEFFLMCNPKYRCLQPRFDVIEILARSGECWIRHLKNAF